MAEKNTVINIEKLLKSNKYKDVSQKEVGVILFCKIAKIFRYNPQSHVVTLDFENVLKADRELFLSLLAHLYGQEYGDKFLDEHLKIVNLDGNSKISLEEAWSEAFDLFGRGGFF